MCRSPSDVDLALTNTLRAIPGSPQDFDFVVTDATTGKVTAGAITSVAADLS